MTHFQIQRRISYITACSILIDKRLKDMKEELNTLHDEDTILDLVDDLMATIEITDYEEEEEEEEEEDGGADKKGGESDSDADSDQSSKASQDNENEGDNRSVDSKSSGNTSTTNTSDEGIETIPMESTIDLTTADSKKFISPIDYKGLSLSFIREERRAVALVCMKPAEHNPLLPEFEAEPSPVAGASRGEKQVEDTLCDYSDQGSVGVVDLQRENEEEDHDNLHDDEDDADAVRGGDGDDYENVNVIEQEQEEENLKFSDKKVMHASEFGEEGGMGYIEGEGDEEQEEQIIAPVKKVVNVEEMPPENRVPLVNTHSLEAFETITTDLGEDEVNYGYIFPTAQEKVDDTADHQTRESLHGSYVSLIGNRRPYEKTFVITKIAKKVDLGKTRICWRSRVMPKQSKISAKDQEKALLKRSSRVIHLIPMLDIPVSYY